MLEIYLIFRGVDLKCLISSAFVTGAFHASCRQHELSITSGEGFGGDTHS